MVSETVNADVVAAGENWGANFSVTFNGANFTREEVALAVAQSFNLTLLDVSVIPEVSVPPPVLFQSGRQFSYAIKVTALTPGQVSQWGHNPAAVEESLRSIFWGVNGGGVTVFNAFGVLGVLLRTSALTSDIQAKTQQIQEALQAATGVSLTVDYITVPAEQPPPRAELPCESLDRLQCSLAAPKCFHLSETECRTMPLSSMYALMPFGASCHENGQVQSARECEIAHEELQVRHSFSASRGIQILDNSELPKYCSVQWASLRAGADQAAHFNVWNTEQEQSNPCPGSPRYRLVSGEFRAICRMKARPCARTTQMANGASASAWAPCTTAGSMPLGSPAVVAFPHIPR